jgi:hypothetical protein
MSEPSFQLIRTAVIRDTTQSFAFFFFIEFTETDRHTISVPKGIQSCKARNSTWKHWSASNAPVVIGCMKTAIIRALYPFQSLQSYFLGLRPAAQTGR